MTAPVIEHYLSEFSPDAGRPAASAAEVVQAVRRYVGDVDLTHDEADAVLLLAYALEQRRSMAS